MKMNINISFRFILKSFFIFIVIFLTLTIISGYIYKDNLRNYLVSNSLVDSKFLDADQVSNKKTVLSKFEEKTPFSPSPTSIESNFLIFGDVFWGRFVEQWSMNSPQKYAYPFSNLNTFERDKYNFWVANLECPVTENKISAAQQDALLKFNCRPEFLTEARKYFDIFSLANNHTDNMGEEEGLKETRKHLEKNDLQYFGHYDNSIKKDICEVVSIPTTVAYSEEDIQSFEKQKQDYNSKVNKYYEENGDLNFIKSSLNLENINQIPAEYKPKINSQEIIKVSEFPVVFCGYHNVFKLPTDDEIAEIKNYSDKFIVFVMPHQGAEYGARADSLQQSTFRKMIDSGADGVFGGHTHTVHNTEVYKDKLIVYSIGNAIFDQQFNSEVTTGAVVEVNLEISNSQKLQKWLDADLRCDFYKDKCLTKVKELNLEKPGFKINYDIIALDSANKITKKGDQTKQSFIENRMNWSKTAEELGN